MLECDFAIADSRGLLRGIRQNALRAGADRKIDGGGNGRTDGPVFVDPRANGFDSCGWREQRGHNVVARAQDTEQQMLGIDFSGAGRARFVSGEEDGSACRFGKSLEHGLQFTGSL